MRGFWYTFEAVIAGILILSFLAVLAVSYYTEPQAQRLNLRAHDMLRGLDERGLLRNFTVAGDYSGLNSQIALYGYNHSIEICNAQMSCVGSRPTATNIWSASYLVAGDDNKYQPHYVRLYLWTE